MQQHYAIISEQLFALLEERVVVIYSDMLEHSNRYDTVERAGDIAIVLQPEARSLIEPLFDCAFVGDRVLLFRERDTGHIGAANFGEIDTEPAPAAADIQHT